MWEKMGEYLSTHWQDILIQVRDHLMVSLIALLIACLIGIPLGYFASLSEGNCISFSLALIKES